MQLRTGIPNPELSLKAVADYFGVPTVSAITNGLEAQFLYYEYRSCREPEERARLQSDLIAYNRDDLEATAAMAQIMRSGPESWPAAQANGWEEHRARRTVPPPRLRPRVRPAPNGQADPQRHRLSRIRNEPAASSSTGLAAVPAS